MSTNDRILTAFRDGRELSLGPKVVSPTWNRDTVSKGIVSGLDIIYYLHGTAVAAKRGDVLRLGVDGGAWQTVTTKSRINAFARHYGLPTIRQRNYVWTWSDGVKYTGWRDFDIGKR